MSRYVLWMMAVLVTVEMKGQMFPLSDQYLNNMLAINPAFAGCHDALSTSLLYRTQWVGFEDAPKTQMFSVHAPVNRDRIGVGLNINHNSIGIFNRNDLMGNYAFRREMLNGKLALGLGFGVTLYRNAWDDLEAADEGDDLLVNNPVSAALPSFSLGAYYYTSRFFVGLSLPMFLSHVVDENTGKYTVRNDFSAYNYFLSTGYEVDLNPNISLLPAIILKYMPDHAVQLDFSVQAGFWDRIILGMGYRNKNILMAIVQCRINDQLRLTYAYDTDMGALGGYKNGSHEIGIHYVFSYAHHVAGPRKF